MSSITITWHVPTDDQMRVSRRDRYTDRLLTLEPRRVELTSGDVQSTITLYGRPVRKDGQYHERLAESAMSWDEKTIHTAPLWIQGLYREEAIRSQRFNLQVVPYYVAQPADSGA